MSSLYKHKMKLVWTLNIKDPQGMARRIYLPQGTAKKDAQTFKNKCDALVAAVRLNESLEDSLITWLEKQPEEIRAKLIRAGLLAAGNKDKKPKQLGEWCEYYITPEFVSDKETRRKLNNVKRKLIIFFGKTRLLKSISKLDARRFVDALTKSRSDGGFELSAATTGPRAVGYVRQIFAAAVDDDVIKYDPFKQKKISATVGRGRGVFVPRAVRQKIYEVLPDNIWRLRHLLICENGLACPSELNHLRWCDIDWSQQSMIVYKQKTKKHRKAGIMPAVLPLLRSVFDSASEGSEFVVPSLTNTHMARMYNKFIIQADVQPWECLFVSLRKSAVNDAHDWAQLVGIPTHVIDEWFGHTKAVSDKYYKAANENHYSKLRQQTSEGSQNSGFGSQIGSQQPSEPIGITKHAGKPETLERHEFQQDVIPSGIHRKSEVGDIGFEPMTPSLSSWCSNQLS